MGILKTLLVFVFGLALVSGIVNAETNSDEVAIRAINTAWLQHIADHNAAACADLYADDGAIMPTGQPAAKGREAIQGVWQAMFDMPGFSLTFESEKITVSASADMALDIGTYVLRAGEGEAAMIENGKFVIGWVKRDSEWQIATDIFNSNGTSN